MKLFVGLGNPGSKYARNRHNIGFMAIDAIAASHGFSADRTKFQAQLAEGKLGVEKVFLLKPETYMNLSGQSVGEAMRFFKMTPDDVVVFHDELDLAPGRVRTKTGGGHAGHNGLRSIHEHIGPDYHRVRIGIGHPGDKRLVSGYVLHDFAKADESWIEPLLAGVADGAAALAAADFSGFMNKVALRTQPPRSGGGSSDGRSGDGESGDVKSGDGKSRDRKPDDRKPDDRRLRDEAGGDRRAEPRGAEPRGAESRGAESRGAESRGAGAKARSSDVTPAPDPGGRASANASDPTGARSGSAEQASEGASEHASREGGKKASQDTSQEPSQELSALQKLVAKFSRRS